MINLGEAQDFNIYVLNDHEQSNVDSEGRVAVLNNAIYSNYGIGSRLTSSTTRNDLIVGGVMDITAGTNFNGNSVISDKNNIIKYTMTNNNGITQQPFEGIPLDFKTLTEYLLCASSKWGTITPTGVAEVKYGGLTLTGVDDSLNVFSIDGTNIENSGIALGNLNQINIVAPASSTVLINISGEVLSFGSYGIFRNGITATGTDGKLILWNLFESTTINAGTTSVKGALLAPLATYNSGYTNIEGNLIVKNLYGNIEAHNYLFEGNLPSVCEIEIPVETPCNRHQVITDLIESVALQQTALAHVLNAGAEQLEVVLEKEDIEYILKFNDSLTDIINAVNKLEVILNLKLSIFENCNVCTEKIK